MSAKAGRQYVRQHRIVIVETALIGTGLFEFIRYWRLDALPEMGPPRLDLAGIRGSKFDGCSPGFWFGPFVGSEYCYKEIVLHRSDDAKSREFENASVLKSSPRAHQNPSSWQYQDGSTLDTQSLGLSPVDLCVPVMRGSINS
jgi:hypothetical protein